VANAEQELNNYYKTITGNDHRWLKEHIDNGLPEQNEIEAYYTKSGLALKTYSSNNILLWTGMQNLIFLADSVKAPERLSNLNRFYNEHLTSLGDGVEPSYRRIYFVVKDGKMPDDVEITQPIDPDAVRHLINSAALATNEIIYGSAPVREKTEIIREKNEAIHTQAGQLAEKDREIARLHNNLNDILGSRSYRIAQALKATKNALSPKRRK